MSAALDGAIQKGETESRRDPVAAPYTPLDTSVSGFMVQGSGFRVQGSGFRVQGSGFQGSGFRVQGSGIRVQGPSQTERKTLTVRLFLTWPCSLIEAHKLSHFETLIIYKLTSRKYTAQNDLYQ